MAAPIERVNVLGVGISTVDMQRAVQYTDSLLQAGGRGYICLTGVHGVMEAQSDAGFRALLNRSSLTAPDGMPLVWLGKQQGFTRMRRVFGPDYMMEMCRLSVKRGYRHFLYGGHEGVAELLAAELTTRVPGLQVAGIYTPPFRPLLPVEEADLIAMVAEAKPDIFWVGLGTPKQERFMAQYLGKLDVRIMVGVGAAFDIHSGRLKDAPSWMKSAGLQWLHRLIQEPRRLWRRYLINNPLFLWNASLQLLRIRNYRIDN
jgi:N-acetylglucosaminyldiphosphoundecaprenol N-acetyl-beta-D-mannosaminyltransferase